MCTGTSCTLILNPTGEPPCLPADLALASSRKSSLRISTQKIFRPKRLALKTSMPGAAPAQIASKGFAQDQAPQTVFARPLQAPASESSQSCKLNRPSRLPPMALTRPICRLKCLRFVSLRSLPFSRHVLLLHKEWDVREKGERKDFLPSFLFFRLFQVSRMPLSSKPCASSPAQSRHLRTNGHVGASDCKASFNVLAGRLLQRLCLSSGFRNGFRQTLEAVFTGLPYADKKRYQNLCLSLLRSILDSELRGNVRLIEMLLSAVAALLRSGFKTAVLLDCDAQSLLQAMLENEAQLTRICRTYERSGLTALALLCSFYATVQKERGDTSQSSVFARLLFVRHSFAAFIASASTATLLRTLTSVRVRPQEKSPVRLFLSPEFFAPVFHSHLHNHPLSFVNDLPHTNAPASRERELLQLLSHTGLVGATHRGAAGPTTVD